MKIVNKQEFYNLPNGTLYSDYEPYVFNNLKIKLDTLCDSNRSPFDFYYQDLIGNVFSNDGSKLVDTLDLAIKDKTSFALDFGSISRDGLFEENQLFAIYEAKDIIQLENTIHFLKINYISNDILAQYKKSHS